MDGAWWKIVMVVGLLAAACELPPSVGEGPQTGGWREAWTSADAQVPRASDASDDSGARQSGSGSAADGGRTAADAGEDAPVKIDPACMGRGGETVCMGRIQIRCGIAGDAESRTGCTNAARCRAGLASGRCADCEPGAYRCSAAVLESCNPEGAWEAVETCPSEALCSADNHSCDPMRCAADSFDCSDGMLRSCKPDLTGFQAIARCDEELCDAQIGQCYECVPNALGCADEHTLESCDSEGKGPTRTPCQAPTPFCQNGQCVECQSEADCTSDNECRPNVCDPGTSACAAGEPIPEHTECSAGVCDYDGNCIGCLDDRDCPPSEQCSLVLAECRIRPPLELASALLTGSFSVTVAPDYAVEISGSYADDSGDSSVTISEGLFNTRCTVSPASSSCRVSASSELRTFVIAGPDVERCSIPLPTQGQSLNMGFEDGSESSTCADPTLTLRATR